MTHSTVAKYNMIEQQIRPWEVLDNRVLSVLDAVDRADFVRPAYQGLAYADCQIPVGNGVRMLPPTIEGRMLQALMIGPDDRVLEVGCGSGYLGVCLAQLAQQVTSIDARAEIVDFARANQAKFGPQNCEFRELDQSQVNERLRYDVIAVSASLARVPDNLRQALTLGGRMFIVVGQSPVMEALLITRVGESAWTTQSLFETDLPRLDG